MSTPGFQIIDLRFQTCLKPVIVNKKLEFPAFSEALNYISLLYLCRNTIPAYHRMLLNAGLFDESIQLRPLLTVPSIRSLRAALLATTLFLRELLSYHTLLSDHALL